MTNSLRILLTEIIDYAGLFPPSQLTMNEAVQNYAKYLKSENAWMLGRFIVPVARLDEFLTESGKVLTKKNPWRLSVISGDDLSKTLRKVNSFNTENGEKVLIDTLEIKVETPAEIRENAKLLPNEITAYFEISIADHLSDSITALALTRNRAKIRTGGITQDAFPPSDEIIKFMRICIAANVPFKATAGLHHPLRSIKPLTCETDAINGTMHGFLGVFMSAAFLRQNLNHTFVHELMHEMNADNFRFDDEKIVWKDHSIDNFELELARKRSAISFGSCSFTEPIEELQELGFL